MDIFGQNTIIGDTGAWYIILALIIVYAIPTLIALIRQHPSKGAIFLLNLLGGWTGIFWLLALIWACWKRPSSPASTLSV